MFPYQGSLEYGMLYYKRQLKLTFKEELMKSRLQKGQKNGIRIDLKQHKESHSHPAVFFTWSTQSSVTLLT